MTADRTSIRPLIEAVIDGAPIDWGDVERDMDPAVRELLQALRVVSEVARIHQSDAPNEVDATIARTTGATPRGTLGRWGDFALMERLGEGSLGEVYRAWDPQLEREIALKLLRHREEKREAETARLVREARLLARVRHPSVVAVYGVATHNDRVGLWMELIRGATLEHWLTAHGALGAREAALIGIDVCRGLSALHAAGLAHRDVKTQNIMREDGGRIVLMDLGLGQEMTPAGSVAESHAARGTPLYMAPELFTGRAGSARTDIYSLGVLLYRMVTRSFPVEARTLPELAYRHARGLRTRLRDARPDLPMQFVQAVEQAISPDPESRFDTVGALESVLVHALQVTDAAAVRTPCVAVLPLANFSADPDTDYFSDGLTEELITALSQLSALRVVSRTSVFEFKGKALDVRKIGEQLGASSVLEGSVRRSGDRLRVAVQLTDVADGCQIWASKFDRANKDVFEIQDEIATTVAVKLKVTLGGPGTKGRSSRYTDDLDAYHLYLKGRFHWNRRTAEGFDKAREYFESALNSDPHYAPAYSGLADYYISVASWGFMAPDAAWNEARAAATKALAADPALAEAHASMGAVLTYYERDWASGEKEFRRARELAPSDTSVMVQYATQLIQLGRLSEARQEMARAFQHDPLSAMVNTYVAGVAYYSRRFDEAVSLCAKALELAPTDIEAQCVLGLAYEGMSEFDRAIDVFERARVQSGDYPVVVAALAAACARAGRDTRAQDMVSALAHMAGTSYVPPIAWAWVHIATNALDEAFERLFQAAEGHDMLLCYLAVGPVYDALRAHPRYPELMRRIGLFTFTDSTMSVGGEN